MTIGDKIKRMVFKNTSKPVAPPSSNKEEGEEENPYLANRRKWNSHTAKVSFQRQIWQVLCILAMLIVLAAVGGVIHFASQSTYIPYVIEVDKHGQTVASGPVTAASKTDPRVIHASIAEFITDARMVSLDIALQRRAVFRVYSKLSPTDPATPKMNEWLNGTPESSPFARARKELVSIQIESVLQQTPESWQIDWVETVTDREGVTQDIAIMRATATVYTAETTASTTDEELRLNPSSVHVRDFSWTRLK